jgi:glycerol-3-phosphate O-acyltransferase
MLAYYRNNVIHLFLNEAYVATAFSAFGEQSQDVSLKRLWDQTKFLTLILREEFVVRNQINDFDCFLTTLRLMEKR